MLANRQEFFRKIFQRKEDIDYFLIAIVVHMVVKILSTCARRRTPVRVSGKTRRSFFFLVTPVEEYIFCALKPNRN